MPSEEVFIVTGGGGFIGSHTVERLLEQGQRVVVLDDFSTGRHENLAHLAHDSKLRVIEIDIAEGTAEGMTGHEAGGIAAALEPFERDWSRPPRIIHLAAQTSVIRSIEDPIGDIRVNYAGTANVVEYARRCGASRLVFASSAATYGDVLTVPVEEQAARWPLSPYGIDKLASEMFLRYAHDVHGLETVALRFFNVYGPRQDPTSPYSGVISIFIERALAGEPLAIYGDGQQTRDFVYVADVARALVTAATADGLNGAAAGVGTGVGTGAATTTGSMNIGTGRETSIEALAQTIVRACGAEVEIRHEATRGGEILRSRADVSRARSRLGFEAEVVLEDGIERTVGWFQEQRGHA